MYCVGLMLCLLFVTTDETHMLTIFLFCNFVFGTLGFQVAIFGSHRIGGKKVLITKKPLETEMKTLLFCSASSPTFFFFSFFIYRLRNRIYYKVLILVLILQLSLLLLWHVAACLYPDGSNLR